jgi:uncharacterized protein (DUF2249 family)
MNDTAISPVEQLMDVRALPPRERHPAIFDTWKNLSAGQAILLVNDHDPVPLYYQFACEHHGEFHWEYLDQGPEVWRVRLRKGDFADPGFRPARKASACGCNAPSSGPVELDTRPIFQRGETPCAAIDEAVARVGPGQTLTLLVPFEPVPLYAKLGREGFAHQSQQLGDGSWRVEFRRAG